MDSYEHKSCETTYIPVEVINSKRQVKRKLGHVVQLYVNVTLNLSHNDITSQHGSVIGERYQISTAYLATIAVTLAKCWCTSQLFTEY